MNTKLLISALAALCLVACKQGVGHPDPHFGEAVKHNIAVQTVNPNAPNDKGPITYNAERQALAQKRYETNKVEKPADISTSTVMIGNPGGGSGGGSK